MKFKASLVLWIAALITLSACGQGSSTSNDARARQSSFVGTQTIVLSNGADSASEVDDFVLNVDGEVVTIVDEDFSATGELSPDNQFILSSPIFSTSSDGITCTGSVLYAGGLNGQTVSGSISGQFNCSDITFAVSGEFSGSR